jgi:hypothetical protein
MDNVEEKLSQILRLQTGVGRNSLYINLRRNFGAKVQFYIQLWYRSAGVKLHCGK